MEEVRSKSAILLEQLSLLFRTIQRFLLFAVWADDWDWNKRQSVKACWNRSSEGLDYPDSRRKCYPSPAIDYQHEEIQQGIAILKEVFSRVDE